MQAGSLPSASRYGYIRNTTRNYTRLDGNRHCNIGGPNVNTTTIPDAAERDRYVYVERPRCPRCTSPKLKTLRSEDQGDDSTMRTTVCRDCRHKFYVVVE